MKQVLLFALSFLVVSAALTWLWLAAGNSLYVEFMTPIANGVYESLGFSKVGTMNRTRFINLVPFTALMLLTPRLSLRRRFLGLGLGLAFLSISHVALNGIAIASGNVARLPRFAMLTSDALPFLLWFLCARESVLETLRRIERDT